jgi:putative ATP-dependent endonuclease of OLD family
LVEGPTEALALPQLLRARGFDVLKHGVAVVSVEGIGNIAKWHRLFTALGIECFCVFDTDSDKGAKDAADLLAKRLDVAAALGRSGDPAAGAATAGARLHVGDGYATLDPNFEGAMRVLFGEEWERLRDEAIAAVGESKPLRARYAAGRLSEAAFAGLAGDRIDALARAIGGGGAKGAPPQDGPDDPDGETAPRALSTHSPDADEPPF